jgi:drug/metabolite transporter (DMT)-like permease
VTVVLIWIGALLVIIGVLFLAVQPLRRGELSGGRLRSPQASDTLEPRRPGRGFGMKSNWPGLALVALGVILLLAAAVI